MRNQRIARAAVQRGYFHVPSTSELLGALAAVAVFFILIGIGLALVVPKVWAWLKPLLAQALL